MQDFQAQLLLVQGRAVGGKTIFDASFSAAIPGTTEMKASTFNPDLAQRAAALQGQLVTARVNVTQNVKNGRSFTNIYLEDIAGSGAALPALPAGPVPLPVVATGPVLAGAVPVVQQAALPPGVTMAPATSGDGGYSPETIQRMVRQNALEAVAPIVASLIEAVPGAYVDEDGKPQLGRIQGVTLALSEAWVYYVYNGKTQAGATVYPAGQAPAEAPIVATAVSPAEVAAQTNVLAGGAVVQVGAPVEVTAPAAQIHPTDEIPW